MPERIIHALSHELSSVVVSLPLMLWIGGLTWQQELMANVGLIVFRSNIDIIKSLFG
jgi:uncharacterized membrane protein